MKKICLNCEFAKVLNEDLDVFDELNDCNDVLICLHSINIINATNINKASGERLKVEAFIVDDNNTCGLFRASIERESDLKHGC